MELPFEIAVIHLCQEGSVAVKQEVVKPKIETPKVAPKVEEKKDVFEDKSEHQRVHQAPIKQETSSPSIAISIDTVTAKMKDIADKAKIPSFAKQSFLTTKPEFSGTKLIFRSESSWHREKLQSEANIRVAIQNAVIDIFQQKIMVEFANGGIPKKQENSEVATAEDVLLF